MDEDHDLTDKIRGDVDTLSRQQVATNGEVRRLDDKLDNMADNIKTEVKAGIKADINDDVKKAIDAVTKAKMADIDKMLDEKWEAPEVNGMARLRTNLGRQPVATQPSHQQEKQQLEANLQACLTRIAELELQAAEKADKAEMGKLRGDVASFGRRIPKVDKIKKDITNLETKYSDLANKVDLIERNQGAILTAIDANTKTGQELRGRIHVLENPLHVRQVNITNLGAVATSVAGGEQPQASTGGCDPKEVSALTTKIEGHDQRLERLETALSGLEPDKIRQGFQWADSKFQQWDKCFEEDFPNKVKEIEATHERQLQLYKGAADEAMAKQKQSAEEQLRQQKAASDKELSDYKESMEEQMKVYKASVHQEYEAHKASKDKEFADYVAKTDAEQKAQNERHDQLASVVNDLLAQLKGQSAGQHSPGPSQPQQPPEGHPQQPTPQPQRSGNGNGPWAFTPAPPNQGQPDPTPEVQMGGVGGEHDLDSEMMEAPPQAPQQPNHQPPQQPLPQPPQPNAATPRDTPMTNDGPIIPNNNANVGAGPKPQLVGGNQPLPGNSPASPSFRTPTASTSARSVHQGSLFGKPIGSGTRASTMPPLADATPASERGLLFSRSVFASGAVQKKPLPAGQKPLPGPGATAKFDFASPMPPVEQPEVDWSATMEKIDLDPPAELADDDEKPSPSKAKLPPVNAPPATPSADKPAANEAMPGNTGNTAAPPAAKTNGSGTTVSAPPMSNNAGSSSTAGAPPSTPAKPQGPAPASTPRPKTAKKKVDPFIKRNPTATPSKPAEVTSKALTTQTKAASLAKQRQEAFENQYSSPLPEKTMTPAPATPKQVTPAAAAPEFRIPGLSYPSKPATPAPKPAASPLANNAAVHDVIDTKTAANIFLKEIEKIQEMNDAPAPEQANAAAGGAEAGATEPAEPANNTGDTQMSDAEEEAEVHESEVNPRKHTADAPVIPQDADPMETDRRVVKASGRSKKLTAAEIKGHKDQFNQMAAWEEMEKAMAYEQSKKTPGFVADDEVDYADPADLNDEDVHTTTMPPPKPKVKPTKYTLQYFDAWKALFLSRRNLTRLAEEMEIGDEFLDTFITQIRDLDAEADLDDLFSQAGLPMTKAAYTKFEMTNLMRTYREEVYFESLRAMSQDKHSDESFDDTRAYIDRDVDRWFRSHLPDSK